MSGDEVVVLLISGMLSAVAWGMWFTAVARVGRPRGSPREGQPARAPLAGSPLARASVAGAPLVAALLLLAVLRTVAAHDVRDSTLYTTFYMVLGAAWVAVGAWLLPAVGLSARDDALERGNPAAAYAIGGAIVAVALCYAGGNIGDGPGWWVVVFSAALSTGALFLLWLGLDAVTGLADTVTIDRDRAAGIRLAGLLMASGAVLGRAVAGDWVSTAATARDFVLFGWPALLFFVAAAALERSARPTAARPAPDVVTYGALPALVFIAAAFAYIASLGAAA